MQNPFRPWAILVIIAVAAGSAFAAPTPADTNDPNAPKAAKAAIITCKGLIDDGLYQSIKRRAAQALEQDADYIILEVETYGGLVQAADDISKFLILDLKNKANTVAYVTAEAISAGAMVSVSCEDIVMRQHTTIGDAAPITMGGTLEGVEREKAESFVRSIFAKAAQANNYPQPLLEAMVTMDIAVYRVENLETGGFKYFKEENMPGDPNTWDLDGAELIVSDSELLTVTADEAVELGIARAVVEDRDGMLAFFESRDNVVFTAKPLVLEPVWSEQLVRFLNSPTALGILTLIALLGLYIELSTPGLGLPGLAAAVAFAIIIGSKYLVGLANWVEVAIFLLGIILLLIEFLLIPGFGIAGIAGIICIFAGLFGMLLRNPPDRIPWPQTAFELSELVNYLAAMAVGTVLFVVAAWITGKFIPRFQFLSGLSLTPTPAKTGLEREASVSAPGPAAAAINIGDVGTTLTRLRPAGKAVFGESIVDVVSAAQFLDKDQKVQIIQIYGNRVVVKPLPETPAGA